LQASGLPFFACAKKGNPKKAHPGDAVSRHPATAPALHYLRHPCRRLPSDFARGLRGSLNVRPCTCNELARIVRARAKKLAARQSMDGRVRGSRAPSAVPSIGARAEKTRRAIAMDRDRRASAQGRGGNTRGALKRISRRRAPKPWMAQAGLCPRSWMRSGQSAVARAARARSAGDFDSQEANQNTALRASLLPTFGRLPKVGRSP
jgi:hypothetical protein